MPCKFLCTPLRRVGRPDQPLIAPMDTEPPLSFALPFMPSTPCLFRSCCNLTYSAISHTTRISKRRPAEPRSFRMEGARLLRAARTPAYLENSSIGYVSAPTLQQNCWCLEPTLSWRCSAALQLRSASQGGRQLNRTCPAKFPPGNKCASPTFLFSASFVSRAALWLDRPQTICSTCTSCAKLHRNMCLCLTKVVHSRVCGPTGCARCGQQMH